MKKIMICITAVLICLGALAQKSRYDSVAILIIDRMSDVISDLEACSFKLKTAQDISDHSSGMTKRFTDYEVFMSGPTKMMVNANGYKGHRTFRYNGEQLAFYSFDEHNYAVMPGNSNIIATMDSINKFYDIEFPAADFFYPAFTDDLIENADSIIFLGREMIGGKEYFHIQASGKERDFQFWIHNDAYALPGIFSVTYKLQEGTPQYLAIFSDWQVNPNLPSAMFDFEPPPGSRKIRLMAKNEK